MLLIYHPITNSLPGEYIVSGSHGVVQQKTGLEAVRGKWGPPGHLCKVGCTHGSMETEEKRLLNVGITRLEDDNSSP